MVELYDLYIHRLASIGVLDGLNGGIWIESVGRLAKESILNGKGYLNLSINIDKAKELANGLKEVPSNSIQIIPIRYRDFGRISMDIAFATASVFLMEKKKLPKYNVETWEDEVKFLTETNMTWSFVLGSPSLCEKGAAPSGIVVTVDKISGEVWNDDDFYWFYEVLNG